MQNLTTLFNIVWDGIGSAYNWLESLLSAYGIDILVVLISIVAIHSIMKYVFSPVFGGGSSDNARRRKQ